MHAPVTAPSQAPAARARGLKRVLHAGTVDGSHLQLCSQNLGNLRVMLVALVAVAGLVHMQVAGYSRTDKHTCDCDLAAQPRGRCCACQHLHATPSSVALAVTNEALCLILRRACRSMCRMT